MEPKFYAQEDKYKGPQARAAFEQEKETEFVDGEGLEMDLVDPSELDDELARSAAEADDIEVEEQQAETQVENSSQVSGA